MNPHEEPAPTLDEVWRLFRETDRKFQETWQQMRETTQQMKETDRKFQETDRKLNKLEQLFTSQWGRLVESLVDGAVVDLLRERGIAVDHTVTRAKGTWQGHNWEFDIIAKNGDEVAIVEVKTTLRPSDVPKFKEKLAMAKTWMREYAGNRIYGAVAFIQADAGAEVMAQKQGLFVIRATGSGATLVNAADFVPTAY